jgi:hypothetical protein
LIWTWLGKAMQHARPDHFALLAADAERSLEGLSHSLSQGAEGMEKGALHAIDLVSALTSIDFSHEALIVQDIARQLALGQPAVIDIATGLTPYLQQALANVRQGQPHDDQSLQKVLKECQERLQWMARKETPTPAAFQMPLLTQGVETGRVNSDVASLSRLNSLSYSLDSAPAIQWRRQNLDLLQQAKRLTHEGTQQSLRRLEALLNEMQDRSTRIGQADLRSVYPHALASGDEIWVDPKVLDVLQNLSDLSSNALQVRAEVRSLTLFIDWLGLSLKDTELAQTGERLQLIQGRIQHNGDGYRLVLPCSLLRMRMHPFVLHGQKQVVSGPQFIQSHPLPNHPTGRRIDLRAGATDVSLHADVLLPPINMNVFPIPPEVSAPAELMGVALDDQAQIYWRWDWTRT